jgi:TetR/AcrR family transcriptional repressor of nem operon
MQRSHERIVEGAARLLRERGVDKTSVADVMEAAGLTHGGFYRHFDTKDALVSAAIATAFAQLREVAATSLQGKEPDVSLTLFRSYYLSDAHLNHPGEACPVATLAAEFARAPPRLKSEFGKGVRRILEVLAGCCKGTGKKQREAQAAREFARLVGAAVIARACDPETAKTVLAACR